MTDKPLPSNTETERFIAGALLEMSQDDIKKYSSMLERFDFTDVLCLEVCRAVRELIRRDMAVDHLSIGTLLPNKENELIELSSLIATTANIDTSMIILKQFSAHRKAIKATYRFMDGIFETTQPLSEINNLSKELNDISGIADIESNAQSLKQVKSVLIKDGISSGYITHDYNDGGLKSCRLTLLLGAKNHGKTTIARLMILACSKQNKKSFFFAGENGAHEEKSIFAMNCAKEGGLQVMPNIGGRPVYYPTKATFEAFEQLHAGNIQIIDDSLVGKREKLFNYVLRKMEDSAKSGAKLFVLDSLTVLEEGEGNKIFAHQKEIITKLNTFKKNFDAHVILIVHPKKGKGLESVSGNSAVEKLCDTMLRYVRLSDNDQEIEAQNYKKKSKVMARVNMSNEDKNKITAMVLNEKVRDRGAKLAMFLEWDNKRGVATEVSMLPLASEYEKNGYWTRAIHRYGSEDIPKDYTDQRPYKDN